MNKAVFFVVLLLGISQPVAAGVYTSAEGILVNCIDVDPDCFPNCPDVVCNPFIIVHPIGYTGTGGPIDVDICIKPSDVSRIQPALVEALAIWDGFTASTGNCVNCLTVEETGDDTNSHELRYRHHRQQHREDLLRQHRRQPCCTCRRASTLRRNKAVAMTPEPRPAAPQDEKGMIFDCSSTSDDVLSDIDLGSKTVLVTGASTGLGAETARALAVHGAALTLVARSTEKLTRVAEKIRSATGPQGAAATCWAATSPSLNGKTGLYLEDCEISKPAESDDVRQGGYLPHAYDEKGAAGFWDLSNQLLGTSF